MLVYFEKHTVNSRTVGNSPFLKPHGADRSNNIGDESTAGGERAFHKKSSSLFVKPVGREPVPLVRTHDRGIEMGNTASESTNI